MDLNETVSDGNKIPEFEEIKLEVAEGKEPSRSVRELLRWFGARRRRSGSVERIEAELEAAGIVTEPHFTTTWIDSAVTFKKMTSPASQSAGQGTSATATQAIEELPDVTHLVRMLEAANRDVLFVNPQDPLEKAITLMLAYDFSQLAVMTGPRDLKGAISWKSIGSRLSQQRSLTFVSDAMEPASKVLDTESLFEATKVIIRYEYAFVESSLDKKITGIVTATDLSEQFQGLSEPFLLLARIENQIRRMIQKVFDLETLRSVMADTDPDRRAKLSRVSELSIGDYIRLFEQEQYWTKLGFVADRKTFCAELEKVRKLRNEIMHFHLDVVGDEDSNQLRRFSRLLDQLTRL